MSPLHLVGHDGTSRGEDALALARALAPPDAVRRVVVHVIEPTVKRIARGHDAHQTLREEAKKQFATLRASLRPGEELRLVDAPSAAHGLHALPRTYFDFSGTGGLPPARSVESEHRAAGLAARAANGLDGASVGAGASLTPLGSPGKAIVAATACVELIVCGSRAHGPLGHVLLGSTGHHVLHHAPCSVVIVPRPEAQVSAPALATAGPSKATA